MSRRRQRKAAYRLRRTERMIRRWIRLATVRLLAEAVNTPVPWTPEGWPLIKAAALEHVEFRAMMGITGPLTPSQEADLEVYFTYIQRQQQIVTPVTVD